MSNNGKPIALQNNKEKTASKFESFLAPEEDKLETDQVDVEEIVEEEELSENEESSENEELSNEEEIVEDEESEIDDIIEGEEQQEVEEEIEQPETFFVKIDGKEQEVTLEELQNGYSRQQDYTRKTQELAEQKKEIIQQQEELSKRDALYQQLLPKLEAQLKGDLENEPDWDKLIEDDPYTYVRQKQIWDDKKEKLKATQAEQQRLQEENFVKQQEQIQQMVQEGQKKLLKIIPEWQDPKIAQSEKIAIRDYGINVLGYSAEEMDAVYDYRALIGLRNAWLQEKTQKAVKKKPVQKAKSRVARPGTTNKPKTTTPVMRAKKRLAKSGKVQDAAKVFEQFIK